jgi:hypothetical protein
MYSVSFELPSSLTREYVYSDIAKQRAHEIPANDVPAID